MFQVLPCSSEECRFGFIFPMVLNEREFGLLVLVVFFTWIGMLRASAKWLLDICSHGVLGVTLKRNYQEICNS